MSRLSARGLTVDVPRGWDARIYRRADVPPGAATHAVLHAANFALPEERGDFGSNVVERMGRAHVLVSLVEFDEEAAATPLFANRGRPPRVTAAMFSPSRLQRTLAGQAGTQVFFNEGGRAFCLYVVLGSHRDRAALVPVVNELVESLRIAPR